MSANSLGSPVENWSGGEVVFSNTKGRLHLPESTILGEDRLIQPTLAYTLLPRLLPLIIILTTLHACSLFKNVEQGSYPLASCGIQESQINDLTNTIKKLKQENAVCQSGTHGFQTQLAPQKAQNDTA